MSAPVLPIPQVELAPESSRSDGSKVQHIYTFANGYSASVIQGPYSYGGPAGLWEIAVLRDGRLDYSTPITDDVLGRLTDSEVGEVLAAIAALPVQS